VNTHSEIQAVLRKQGITGHLTPPPKRYIATLVNEETNETVSTRFQIPATDPIMPNEAMVILTLIQRVLPTEKITCGEYEASTLDFLLENELSEKTPMTKIPGAHIRYKTIEDKPTRNRGERFASSTNWRTLPEHIRLHIARDIPWIVDNDPKTVEKNRKEAEALIQTNISNLKSVIDQSTHKRGELEDTLEILKET